MSALMGFLLDASRRRVASLRERLDTNRDLVPVDDQICYACRTDPSTGFIRDHHLVTRDRATQPDGGGHPGHDPLTHRRVVRRVDVEADGALAERVGMDDR